MIKEIVILIILLISLASISLCLDDWQKAMELYKLGDYVQALKEFKQILKYNSKLTEGYFMVGLCNYHLGKNTEAKENFQKALVFNPNHNGSLYYLGKIYYDEKDYKEAIKYLSLAMVNVDDINTKSMILKLRGACYLKINAYEDAIDDLNKVVETNQKDAVSYYILATAYYNNNKAELAEKSIKIAIGIDPNNKDFLILLLNILIEQKKYKEILIMSKDILEKHNNDQEIVELIADAYLGDKNYKEAILYYDRLLQPKDKTMFNKVQAYVGLGEYKKAEDILIVLNRKTGNQDERILSMLAYVYEKNSKLEDAKKIYQLVYNFTKKIKYKESIERIQEKIKQQNLESDL